MTTDDGERKVSIQIDTCYPGVTYLVFFDRHVFDFLCFLSADSYVNTANM